LQSRASVCDAKPKALPFPLLLFSLMNHLAELEQVCQCFSGVVYFILFYFILFYFLASPHLTSGPRNLGERRTFNSNVICRRHSSAAPRVQVTGRYRCSDGYLRNDVYKLGNRWICTTRRSFAFFPFLFFSHGVGSPKIAGGYNQHVETFTGDSQKWQWNNSM